MPVKRWEDRPWPEEAMEVAIRRALWSRYDNRPGAVIEALPDEMREALRSLRSEDIDATHAPRHAGGFGGLCSTHRGRIHPGSWPAEG